MVGQLDILWRGMTVPAPATGCRWLTWHAAFGTALRRFGQGLRVRRPVFDHLPLAARVRRDQIATFACQDGRLWAEWSGLVRAEQPARLETDELDAEWMIYAPADPDTPQRLRYWMLARRDLRPGVDGRYGSVSACCFPPCGQTLRILAILEHPALSGQQSALCVSFSQSPDSVRLRWCTQRLQGTGRRCELAAGDVGELLRRYPREVAAHLAPALWRVAGIQLQPTHLRKLGI